MTNENLTQKNVAALKTDLNRLEEELRLISHSNNRDRDEVETQKNLIKAEIISIKRQLKRLDKDGADFNSDSELDKAAERLLEQFRAK